MSYLSVGLGGVGLFLLGMWLITEGLRLAAGASLERLLARWTSSRWRGLLSGILLTAVIQSSSVVTVAAIGFVNAGLMSFQRAVWVIFGSNVGTTLTAWLVALIGFKFQIDAFALPIIGLGALLRLFSPQERYRSFGMALAGFGVLFLGIETLSGGFSSLSDTVSLDHDSYGLLAMVLIGFVLTTLMMSSTVAVTVVLTALAGGLVSFADAAAVVIGTNIGTTTKALLAALGTTSNAKRLALAHIIFNLFTATVMLVLLGPLLKLVLWLGGITGHAHEAPTMLALFHTLFNVLGVLLMWPLEPLMTRVLMRCFVEEETTGATLRYLDRNLATVPDTAPVALWRELAPLLAEYPAAVAGLPAADAGRREHGALRRKRLDAIGDFFVKVSSYPISTSLSGVFSDGWRIQHNLLNVDETLLRLDDLAGELRASPDYALLERPLGDWFRSVAGHLDGILAGTEGTLDFVVLAPEYEQLKQTLLQAALSGQISRASLDAGLQMCSLSRRLAEQWLRAFDHWRDIRMSTEARPVAAAVEELDAVTQE